MASVESTKARFQERVVFITGAARGIGRAHALAFAREGARLVLCDACRQYSTVPYPLAQPEELASVAREIEQMERPVIASQTDVTQLAAMQELAERAQHELGPIDIVVANAGVGEFAPFGAVTEEHFDRLFNINVRGTLFTVQKALPLLNDGGSIILNGSVASVKGTAAFGVYAASKAALRSFVRTWTTDLKDRRIRSNVVSPGPINTPLASRQSADVIARMVSTIPMGRMGEPEEVAKVALFLASDDSSFVTGIELFVDGGRAQV